MEQPNKNQGDNISNPSLEVDIRTMEGDVRALKETGGETMGLKGERENISRQNEPTKDELSKFSVPGNNFIFPQSQKTTEQEAKSFEAAPSNVESVKVNVLQKKTAVWKIILIILGIIVIAAGFGFLGYYLSPMIFGK